MTQVHFTLNSEEVQSIIEHSVKDDVSKNILTTDFNQLMENQRTAEPITLRYELSLSDDRCSLHKSPRRPSVFSKSCHRFVSPLPTQVGRDARFIFLRNLFSSMPKKNSKPFRETVKAIFKFTNIKLAWSAKNALVGEYIDQTKYTKACETFR